jgi:DNA-binding protein H-NS
MTSINLDTLSLSDLKSLQKDIAKAIADFSDRKKTEAMAELEAHAKEMGFSLAELIRVKKQRKFSRTTAKYRHPENAEITWSGRGRKPGWFAAALKAGKAPETMAI